MVVTPQRQSEAAFSFWPIALAICLIVVLAAAIGIRPAETILRPTSIKALFFALGFIFPIVAFALARDRISPGVRSAVAGAGALLIVVYIFQARQLGVIPFALLELVVAWPLLRTMWRLSDGRIWTACSIVFAVLGGWSIAATLNYASPISDLVLGHTPYGSALGMTLTFIAATVVGSVALTWTMMMRASRLVYVIDAITVALISNCLVAAGPTIHWR